MPGGKFLFAGYLTTIQGLGATLPGVSLLFIVSWAGVSILNLIFGLVVIIVAYLVAAAGYPILVSQGFEHGKIQLVRVFKDATSRMLDVLLYILAMIGIAVVLGLGGMVFAFVIIIPFIGWLLLLFYMLFVVFIVLRLWLVLPVLMVGRTIDERKLRVREAFSFGLEYTSGKAFSILGTLTLLFLTVFLPLNILSIYIPSSLVGSFWISTLWINIVGLLKTVFSAILPTIYYYTSVRKMEL